MDANDLLTRKAKENRIWYIGDSNELLNYYRVQNYYGNASEPIYNQNRKNYFWGISTKEAHIKRVHSGVPRGIVTAITNVIGVPSITVDGRRFPRCSKRLALRNSSCKGRYLSLWRKGGAHSRL